MKYFLTFIILALCGGGYYEYTQLQHTQQTQLAEDQQQIADLGSKMDALQVNDSDGISKILFGLLPLDLQRRFGYDPHQAAAATATQIQVQEAQTKATGQAADN